MRIGIECSTLTRPRAGIGFYTYNLIQALAQLDGEEEYSLLYNRPLPDMKLSSRFRHVLRGPSSTHLWAQSRLSSICHKEGIDLLHSPGQALPLLYQGKSILTIHDLSPMIYPRQKDFVSRIIWNSLVPIMANNADHIITVSDNTRQDVIERLGISPRNITRIYEAAAPDYYPIREEQQLLDFRKQNNLVNGFILSVSTLEPRKNYPFLLKLFSRWLEQSHSGATLVIIGKKGWLYDEIFETYEALNLQDQVRFVGYVDDMETMRLYYSAAEFTILTPLYEGFCLPCLESLACGTPVIAPRHSSIPEVVGNAGLLLESWEKEEWLAAMDQLWKCSNREEWSQKGIERSDLFTWKQAAQETLNVYRSLIG